MMKARMYLSEIRLEYVKIREAREKLRLETDQVKQNVLREHLKTLSSFYTGVLNEIWDTIEQLEPGVGQDILLWKYVFLMSNEEIARELGYAVKSLYRHHSKAIRQIQRILDGKRGAA